MCMDIICRYKFISQQPTDENVDVEVYLWMKVQVFFIFFWLVVGVIKGESENE